MTGTDYSCLPLAYSLLLLYILPYIDVYSVTRMLRQCVEQAHL